MALSWTQVADADTGGNITWHKAVWASSISLFVAVGNRSANAAKVETSPDGINWTLRSIPTAGDNLSSVAWSPSLSLLVATVSNAARVVTSSDGINWTNQAVTSNNSWGDVVWAASLNLFVAVGGVGANRVMTSPDGINWTNRTASSAHVWQSIAWSGNELIAAADESTSVLMRSTDGINWTDQSFGVAIHVFPRTLGWAGAPINLFAAATTTNIYTSPTGVTWTARNPSNLDSAATHQFAFSPDSGRWVVGGALGSISDDTLDSTDGITWTQSGSNVNFRIDVLAYSHELRTFVGIEDFTHGKVSYASDGPSLSPTSGSVAGGYTLTINGDGTNGGFPGSGATFNTIWVAIGDLSSLGLNVNNHVVPADLTATADDIAISINVVSSTQITCTIPAGRNGPVDIAVIHNSNTISEKNLLAYFPAGFTYNPPTLSSLAPTHGSPLGGDAITATGTNFYAADDGTVTDASGTHQDYVFKFGSAGGVLGQYSNATTLTCVSPVNAGTTASVTVTLYPGRKAATNLLGHASSYSYPSTSVSWTYDTDWWDIEDSRIGVPFASTADIGTPELETDLERLTRPIICDNPLTAFPAGSGLSYLTFPSAPGFTFFTSTDFPDILFLLLPCDTVPIPLIKKFLPYPPPPILLPPGFGGLNFPPGTVFFWTITTAPDDKGWWESIDDKFNGAANVIDSVVPRNPRSYDEISSFASGSAVMLGGFPSVAAVWKDNLVYAKGGYVVGTDRPPINIFGGQFDRKLAEVPTTTAGVVPKAVMTTLVANGVIYFSTLDSGTDSTNWSGRVFSLDVETATMAQIGSTFPAGHLPYALAFHAGRLWCGTNRQVGSAAGRVYFFRPNNDTDWTLDRDLTTDSVGGVDSMLSFQGKLYVGTSANAGTFAKVLVRGVDNTYSTSLTGSGGAAAANNGFLAMAEFNNLLIATYYNPDTPKEAKIYKFDGSSWSATFVAAATGVPYVGLTTDQDTLLAIGGGLGFVANLQSTTDGTTWADRTTFLTQSTPTSTGLPAFGTLIK